MAEMMQNRTGGQEHILPDIVVCASKERVKGAGEDAFALQYSESKTSTGYIAVFDGCGGMGAQKYQKAKNQSGARLAANVAADIIDRFYASPEDGFHFDGRDAERLETRLKAGLQAVKQAISEQGAFKIGGDLFRELPTTVSLIVSKMASDGNVYCEYLWAGDSRGFLLDQEGICQITEDDLESDEDAYSNLHNDARLSNVVNADRSFILHEKTIKLTPPVMLITATDGCFGYLRTPMHFQHLILNTLMRSTNEKAWEQNLIAELDKVAGDDCAIVISIYGCGNFEECKRMFMKLYGMHNTMYIKPLAGDESEKKAAALWQKFKPVYYRKYIQKRR